MQLLDRMCRDPEIAAFSCMAVDDQACGRDAKKGVSLPYMG